MEVLEQAIGDFLLNELLLNSIPLILCVFMSIEILKSLFSNTKVDLVLKRLYPLLSVFFGMMYVLVLEGVLKGIGGHTRLLYGGIIGLITSAIYDNIKCIVSLKSYTSKKDRDMLGGEDVDAEEEVEVIKKNNSNE